MGPSQQMSVVPTEEDRVRRIDENLSVLRDKIEETEMLPGRARVTLLNQLAGSDGSPAPVLPVRQPVNVMDTTQGNDFLKLAVMRDIVQKSLLIRKNNMNATVISRGY